MNGRRTIFTLGWLPSAARNVSDVLFLLYPSSIRGLAGRRKFRDGPSIVASRGAWRDKQATVVGRKSTILTTVDFRRTSLASLSHRTGRLPLLCTDYSTTRGRQPVARVPLRLPILF